MACFLRRLSVCGMFGLAGCAGSRPSLEVVPHVDLNRYTGIWYEIARYPASFQEGCAASMAEYSLRDDGTIQVINTCRDRTPDGRIRQAKGTARVVDPTTNAKLKVSFFRPFEGDYWIIELGPEYEYAVVGVPDRRFLWILSRTRTMAPDIYAQIIDRLPARGYDPSKLIRTLQPADEPES